LESPIRLKKNCWNCKYQSLKENKTFLGFCNYFKKLGKEKQLIPNHIVDFGCDKFIYKSKTKEEKNITAYIIELFDGKVVP
jgi:hypothetical protein